MHGWLRDKHGQYIQLNCWSLFDLLGSLEFQCFSGSFVSFDEISQAFVTDIPATTPVFVHQQTEGITRLKLWLVVMAEFGLKGLMVSLEKKGIFIVLSQHLDIVN